MITQKLCGVCKTTKPRRAFHRRKASSGGLAACCKMCQRTYDKARLHQPTRVASRLVYKDTAHGRRRLAVGKKAWVARNPSARKAHIILGNALRDGKITKRPCRDCGSKKVHGHHEKYSKPLDVIWLCARCHRAKHERVAA